MQQTSHLKYFVLNDYDELLSDLELFFKKTPNLEILTISILNAMGIRANQWRKWIVNLLPKLKTFRFHFHFRGRAASKNTESIFMEFQDDFWQKEHHWYTEFFVSINSGSIHTVSYPSNHFTLQKFLSQYDYPLLNTSNKYHSVKRLEIGTGAWNDDNDQFYFSNVDSLGWVWVWV
ncbi:hypothetical protein I4U23_027229 [Adineta vaga]|nr:hypothetical protein I4U23_027229 [Adineta vaga]